MRQFRTVLKAADIILSGESEGKTEGRMHQQNQEFGVFYSDYQCPENYGREASRQMKDLRCLQKPGSWVRPCRNVLICLSEGTRSSSFETQCKEKGSEELLSEQALYVGTTLDIITSISSSLCGRSKHDGS